MVMESRKEKQKQKKRKTGKKNTGGTKGLPGNKKQNLTGTLQGNRKGFAFLLPDQDDEADVYIPPARVKGAMHGDRVVIELAAGGRGKRREGEVISILEKETPRLIGTFVHKQGKNWVLPDESRFYGSIRIPGKSKMDAEEGDKVVVQIERNKKQDRELKGAVIENLGKADAPGVDVLGVMKKYSLSAEFPNKVQKELKRIIREDDISLKAQEENRRDLRDKLIVTVDPEDAKDMDDGISLEKLPGGGYRLGVHIADVSNYVREGSALYKEALRRGTSVYLVDRVVHMLPPELSQDRCSLRQDEDRLALSVEIEVDENGRTKDYSVFHSMVRIGHGLAYSQVEEVLQGTSNLPASTQEMLKTMDELARKLKTVRLQQGALDLDIPEPHIELDEEGKPVSIRRKQAGRSESIIEEFMLMANQAVAEYLHSRELPLLYRIHPRPEEEKMITFKNILSMLNIKVPGNSDSISSFQLQKVIDQVKGQPGETTVNYLLLRSLSQARYSAVLDSHYGLGMECYTHFTSPIRRFPDLINHRVLKAHLKGEMEGEKAAQLKEELPQVAENCSQQERKALEAERESQDIKKVEYMLGQEGNIFEGNVSGITSFGMFVELDNTVEGMVSLSDMDDDYYVFWEEWLALIGETTGRRFRLGDRVKIEVARASLEEGIVNFYLLGKAGPEV